MRVTEAYPRPFSFEPESTALLVIDMQHDFMSPGGWAHAMGLDLSLLAPTVPVIAALLDCFRAAGAPVIFTREGYRSDLSDLPPHKQGRFAPSVGDNGPLGRYMITGEPCNEIIPELAPHAGELVIDKPGAGSFYATLLDHILRLRKITHLVVTGVTTDVCVHTTIREGNDRGYQCVLVEDATESYTPEFTQAVIAMMRYGVPGWSCSSASLIDAMTTKV